MFAQAYVSESNGRDLSHIMTTSLRQLLADCTAASYQADKKGTAFFVAPGIALTAAHNISGGSRSVQLQYRQRLIPARIGWRDPHSTLDVALLEIAERNHPCVLMYPGYALDDLLYTFGYPDDYPGGDSATVRCEGHSSGDQASIKLKAGQIRPGMSGAPLLNLRTGAVVGCIVRSRNRSSDLGGRGVSVESIFDAFPQLVDTQAQYHRTDHHDRWARAVSNEAAPGRPAAVTLHKNRMLAQSLVTRVRYVDLQTHSAIRPSIDLIRPSMDPMPDELLGGAPEAPLDHYRVMMTPQLTDALAVLSTHRRCVVLAAAGAGKSVLLNRFALHLAEQRDSSLPLLVRVSDWVSSSPKRSLSDHIEASHGELGPYLRQEIASRRAILILDGLNELPEARPEWISQVRAYLDSVGQWVCSCRLAESDRFTDLLTEGTRVVLRDLDPPRIRSLIGFNLPNAAAADLWTRLGGSDSIMRLSAKVQQHGDGDLLWMADAPPLAYTSLDEDRQLQLLRSGNTALGMCRNPFLAYAIAKLYRIHGTVPTGEAPILHRLIDGLLRYESERGSNRSNQWDSATRKAARQTAARLALNMQAQGLTAVNRTAAAAIVGESNLPHLRRAAAAAVLEFGSRVRFPHQLMQEHLAAEALLEILGSGADSSDPAQLDNIEFEHSWHSIAVMFADLVSERPSLAPEIAHRYPEVALQILRRRELAGESALIAAASARCWSAVEGGGPRVRSSALRVLAAIGADDRPGLDLDRDGIPDIYWCSIARPATAIGLYPVTNAQFGAFVESADGFRNPEWWSWSREAIRWRARNAISVAPKFDDPHAPRENVTWFEARAFSKWLSTKLLMRIDLPTEDEWVAAGRTLTADEYPWGSWKDDHCNSRRTDIGRTSPVGAFPFGRAECGAMDLSGNVWEWCIDQLPGSSDSRPIVAARGGSWKTYDWQCAINFAGGFPADTRQDDIGFRLVSHKQ
jgi:hypothetical protein